MRKTVQRTWTLAQAQKLVQRLHDPLATVGWSVGITGGVLFKGRSTHDLDLILYPLDSENHRPKGSARYILGQWANLRRIHHRHVIRMSWAKRSNSDDDKFVEVYEDNKKRRVDVMWLR